MQAVNIGLIEIVCCWIQSVSGGLAVDIGQFRRVPVEAVVFVVGPEIDPCAVASSSIGIDGDETIAVRVPLGVIFGLPPPMRHWGVVFSDCRRLHLKKRILAPAELSVVLQDKGTK